MQIDAGIINSQNAKPDSSTTVSAPTAITTVGLTAASNSLSTMSTDSTSTLCGFGSVDTVVGANLNDVNCLMEAEKDCNRTDMKDRVADLGAAVKSNRGFNYYGRKQMVIFD